LTSHGDEFFELLRKATFSLIYSAYLRHILAYVFLYELPLPQQLTSALSPVPSLLAGKIELDLRISNRSCDS
jgi:hypothetical protein